MVHFLENQKSLKNDAKVSNRNFGFTFTAVILILSTYPLFAGEKPFVPGLISALLLLFITFKFPATLSSLNYKWMWVGKNLKKITSPIFLFFLFYLAFYPTYFFY